MVRLLPVAFFNGCIYCANGVSLKYSVFAKIRQGVWLACLLWRRAAPAGGGRRNRISWRRLYSTQPLAAAAGKVTGSISALPPYLPQAGTCNRRRAARVCLRNTAASPARWRFGQHLPRACRDLTSCAFPFRASGTFARATHQNAPLDELA